MLTPEESVSLEGAIASLRRDSPEVLRAIARVVNAADPCAEFGNDTIIGSEYGKKPIPGFALTYGQMGAYLNLAVDKYASVLIETEVGVLESLHVRVSKDWLRRLSQQAAKLPEVIRERVVRVQGSSGSISATVTPILPELENQTPEKALEDLRRFKIRLDRNQLIKPDDPKIDESERLRTLLATADAEKAALARMVKTLTIENDQLRKVRAQIVPLAEPIPSKRKARKPTNVEIFNEESRATRLAVTERARQLWLHGDFANHRTMDMVQVIRRMAVSELAWKLPETDEVLARWLSGDAAPEFAKRPGRPPKQKPKE
jgi:hypothetical protein